jgi:citronellol/citronellal dehydrogenase
MTDHTDSNRLVAIITGASRGIGRAIALKLASHDITIVAAAKTVQSSEKLPGTIHDTIQNITKHGGTGLAVKTDVRDEQQIKSLVDSTVANFGRIDIVVNNAGAIRWLPVDELPVRRYDLMMDINARAPYALCHYAIPYLKKQNRGCIINLSPPLQMGALATEQWTGRTAYLMSKFAMTHLTLGLSEELKADHIAVASLWPAGIVDTQATRIFASMFGAGTGNKWYSPEMVADACYEAVRSEPAKITGKVLIVEEFLAECRDNVDLRDYEVPCPV